MRKRIMHTSIFLFSICALIYVAVFAPLPARADTIPSAAERHRSTLVRSAHYVIGMDAPIATLAAQVHQESAWRTDVTSRAGAQGISQFMPGTSVWMAELYPKSLADPQPFNPGWALRAMVHYDLYLFNRNQASSICERWAMTLAAYNGGQGWVNRERRLASASGADELAWFDSIERFNAGRSISNFKENRHYPRVILLRWEPMYASKGWGRGACAERYSF